MNCRSPEVSPLRHSSWRLRDQKTVRPSASERRKVASLHQATIRTCPVLASCTTAGTSPSASYCTRASCSSVAAIGVTVGAGTPSKVKPGRAFLQPFGGDGVHVAFAQDDVVVPPDFDLVQVLGVEQGGIADL